MPSDSSNHAVPDESREEQLDRLAESYIERLRAGQRPSITEYTQAHPELAAEIRDTFAMLERVERVAFDESGGAGGSELPHKELGDYRILHEVGRGGMGIVYEAEQKSLGRRVALKVLPGSALFDPRQLARFRREARAAARLQHANIVPVFGVGDHDGVHYFAMQFIPGQGLDEVVVDLRRLRNHEAAGQDDSRHHSAASSIADSLASNSATPKRTSFFERKFAFVSGNVQWINGVRAFDSSSVFI